MSAHKIVNVVLLIERTLDKFIACPFVNYDSTLKSCTIYATLHIVNNNDIC